MKLNPAAGVEILRFQTPSALAEAAATRWADLWPELRTVALSGGRIAKTFLEAAASIMRDRRCALDAVDFFWSDERCVPSHDPESNFRLAKEAFLEPLQVPAAKVHRIRGELTPEAAANSAEAELLGVIPAQPNGTPVLDLIFLGMGEDGHIASLFPQEPKTLLSNYRVFRAVVGPKPPPERVTMGYRTLASARRVWVLASGSAKAAALGNSLESGSQSPLSRLLGLRDRTLVFADFLG